MSRTTLILIMIFLVVAGAYIAVTQGSTQKTLLAMTTPKIPTITPSKSSLVITTSNDHSENTVSATVSLNAPTEKPSLTQLEIGYDPLVLQATEILPGTLFVRPEILLTKINNRIGRISYAIHCRPQKNEPCSNADKTVLAVITFTVQNTAQQRSTHIKLLPKSLVKNNDDKEIMVEMMNSDVALPNQIDTIASPSGSLAL